MLQGIGLLFPWNSLLCAGGYYNDRLKELPEASAILGYFAVIFMTVKLLFLIFSSFIVHLVTPEQQVIASGIGSTLVFLALTLMPLATSMSLMTFFYLTLVLVFLASLFSAFANNGLYAMLGRYPPRLTQAISNGQGLAGILASAIKIVCILATSSANISNSEIILSYGASTFIIGACSVLFIFMYEKDGPESAQSLQEKAESRDAEPAKETGFMSLARDYWKVFSEVNLYAISVFLVFAITLSVFPGFMFMTQPLAENAVYGDLWPHIHILLFNVGDWIGKSLPMFSALAINKPFFILILSLLRVIYFPLYLFGNVPALPLWKGLSSDVLFYILSVSLGVLNGYLATLAMMFGPGATKKEEDRPKAGTVMVFALTLGLVVGAYVFLAIATSVA